MAGPGRGGVRRRLAAILAADVVGYSRLIAEDEAGTLDRLRALFREVVQPQVARHGGRVFRLLGDSVLAEFPSAVEALRCALAVQEAAASRAAAEPEAGRRVLLRIGLDLGDVAAEGGELHGDGVNVAARLESLAEPGGVVVSAAVRDQARGRLGCGFEDLGPRALKNMPRPVHAIRVRGEARAGGAPHALPPPDRPSLVVLPFENLSGDPEQDYFADGITEELTAALSRVRSFFVIGRTSAFAYKGRQADLREIGRALGVRYALEGSVRKAGPRVRITSQLIETEAARHVWADRVEGDIADIFGLQDRAAEAVTGAVEPSLRGAEIERARRKPTENLDAYDLYLRALPHHHALTPEGTEAALALARQAIALDDGFAPATALVAFCLMAREVQGRSAPGDVEEAIRLARAAVAAGPDDPETLAWVTDVIGYLGRDLATARDLVERALALNPNSAAVRLVAGFVNNWLCRPHAAIAHLERAVRLSPLSPEMPWVLNGFALAHLIAGDYEAALEAARRALRLKPGWASAHRFIVIALSLLGRREETAEAVRALRHDAPAAARVFADRARGLYADDAFNDLRNRALRDAGLPE
jgi:adenylate cyclase